MNIKDVVVKFIESCFCVLLIYQIHHEVPVYINNTITCLLWFFSIYYSISLLIIFILFLICVSFYLMYVVNSNKIDNDDFDVKLVEDSLKKMREAKEKIKKQCICFLIFDLIFIGCYIFSGVVFLFILKLCLFFLSWSLKKLIDLVTLEYEKIMEKIVKGKNEIRIDD